MKTPLRVLLVEDSPSDAKLVVQALRQLEREVTVERVETEETMRAALDGSPRSKEKERGSASPPCSGSCSR